MRSVSLKGKGLKLFVYLCMYGNFRHLADEQCDRNAGVREAVHEVHRSVDRVDNPGRRVGQFGLLPFARFLLTDKPFKMGRYSFQN